MNEREIIHTVLEAGAAPSKPVSFHRAITRYLATAMEVGNAVRIIAICAATMLGGPVLADPWKDESGKGRWGHERRGYRAYNMDREYKQEYRQGNCKIERKWERNGEYKEERKCKSGYGW